MPEEPAKTFPALRARMGDRWYYVTTMTFAEVAKWIRPIDEMHERAELKTWLQRQVRQERREQIATYLQTRPQRFFNAVVAGIYGGEPEWLPVTVENAKNLEDVELGERQATAYGVISISGNEDIFAIDGQHRVEGIREALKHGEELADEELTVIFVAHKMTDEGRERTRRLFTTLNKYARPVSQAELIALNDDDAFAIVTRRLIDDYPGLGSDFVPLNATANLVQGDQQSLTSVIALYEIIRMLAVPIGSRERKLLEQGPPLPERVAEVQKVAVEFWDSLKAKAPPIAAICSSKPEKKVAGKYRTEDGGHLLLRPAGLQAFSKAVRIMMDRGETLKASVAHLCKAPLDLNSPPWVGVLWKASTQTMILKNGRLAVALLLYYAGQKAGNKGYNLQDQYRKALGDEKAKLP